MSLNAWFQTEVAANGVASGSPAVAVWRLTAVGRRRAGFGVERPRRVFRSDADARLDPCLGRRGAEQVPAVALTWQRRAGASLLADAIGAVSVAERRTMSAVTRIAESLGIGTGTNR